MTDLVIRQIGAALDRIDGPRKVSGTAPYAFGQAVDDVAYVWAVLELDPRLADPAGQVPCVSPVTCWLFAGACWHAAAVSRFGRGLSV
jgi:hypothetical protein